jgi:16S rRNA processing protein RimM
MAASSVAPGRAASVVLGRVAGAHGVRGEVRVRWLGDGPANLLGASAVVLADPDKGRDDPLPRRFAIEGGDRGRRGEVRLRLAGIAGRDAAEALRGCWVLAEREALEPLPAGEHYWVEVIGCSVETADGEPLGSVRELWDLGPHDVLVVEAPDGSVRLIPTAGPAIRQIDPGAGRVVVERIPGLLEPQHL